MFLNQSFKLLKKPILVFNQQYFKYNFGRIRMIFCMVLHLLDSSFDPLP